MAPRRCTDDATAHFSYEFGVLVCKSYAKSCATFASANKERALRRCFFCTSQLASQEALFCYGHLRTQFHVQNGWLKIRLRHKAKLFRIAELRQRQASGTISFLPTRIENGRSNQRHQGTTLR